ncbi:NACHT domain-containing protein, partial [Candidatus Magnetominusculus xianensis]|uniref:NACHT domain-containing protein n=1 Tax=Candidatus Magnetominusculus xianensis TaxID=1748249 RepID=UPI0012EDFFA5
MSGKIVRDWGIFAIIDIVDFTPQHYVLGDTKIHEVRNTFYSAIKKKVIPFKFELIKTALDAVFIFGKDPEDFLNFIIDLYTTNPIKISGRFDLKLRTVANSGMFTFEVDASDKKIDIVSKEATKTFRIEKKAKTWELLVTDTLFTALQDYLDKLKYTHTLERWNEALKGFEVLGDITVLHHLTPPWKDEQSDASYPDFYRSKRAELYIQTKKITIFGNLYPPLDMERSFIELTLEKGFIDEDAPDNQNSVKPKHVSYEDRTEIRQEIRHGNITHDIKASQLLQFNKGFILGNPGAGKTTILHHIVFETLKAKVETNMLFINCRDLKTKRAASSLQVDDILSFLTFSFLFPGMDAKKLKYDEKKYLEDTVHAVIESWGRKHLIVLIDAIDESPDSNVMNMIIEYSKVLMSTISAKKGAQSENRVFVSSRSFLINDIKQLEEPIFHVNPLDMEQIRELARRFYGDGSQIFKRLDDRIWREPGVKEIGGTPLTALLLLAYFEHTESFELRYKTYDIYVKFIFRDIWGQVKRDTFRGNYNKLSDFFIEAADDGFLGKYGVIASQYDALSELAYELLFDAVNNITERSVSEDYLRIHFANWIKNNDAKRHDETVSEYEKRITSKANDLIGYCRSEHLLIPSGNRDYVFIHQTVMEFLAARHFIALSYSEKETKTSMFEKERESLETLPIACGRDIDIATEILTVLRQHYETGRDDSTMPFRCLSEIEGLERKSLEKIQVKKKLIAHEAQLSKYKDKTEWVYKNLVKLIMSEDIDKIKELQKSFSAIIPLTRETLLNKYLPKGWDDVYPGIKIARDGLLKVLLSKEVFNTIESEKMQAQNEAAKGEISESLLTLDKDGSPYDKNFRYYKRNINALTGFYGSPNLKHSGSVNCLAVTSDNKYAISGSDDNTLKLWDIDSGMEIRSFIGHSNPVTSCFITKDD